VLGAPFGAALHAATAATFHRDAPAEEYRGAPPYTRIAEPRTWAARPPAPLLAADDQRCKEL
jgi:hypothetical protein